MPIPVFQNGHHYGLHLSVSLDKQGHPMVNIFISARDASWQSFTMLADTGADYTLMPEVDAQILGIPNIAEGHEGKITLTAVGGGSVTAFLHRLVARVPGTSVHITLLVAFSPEVRSRLYGRADMTREFVIAFDSHATHLLRDSPRNAESGVS
jgi:predicted aspartyl protease